MLLSSVGSLRTENFPSLGNDGKVTAMNASANAATQATLRNVIRHPSNRPTARPNGKPTIMATALPVAMVLKAMALCPSGTILTAMGDTMLQKMEWQHATPMRLAMSMA